MLSRILEKQNLLQMSQVLFRCPRINHQVVLLLKDSKSGTAEHGGSKFSNNFYKHARVTKQTLIAPGDLPFNKNSVPPLARPLSPPGTTASAILLPHTPGWSEERPR